MKTYQMLIISWQFDKLFPENQFVFGYFQNPAGPPTRVCVGEVTLRRSVPERGKLRHLQLLVSESQFGKQVMNGRHLPLTLEKARDRGARSVDGQRGNWALHPGEPMIDEAIRIARTFFGLIDLHTYPAPRSIEDLLPHFVMYEHTLVYKKGNWGFVEDEVRRKHGLHASLINMQTIDEVSRSQHIGRTLSSKATCAGCDRFGQAPVRIDPPYENVRLVFCKSCQRTWFCFNPVLAEWSLVDQATAEMLNIKFERLEL